jgi:hypothetical protein
MVMLAATLPGAAQIRKVSAALDQIVAAGAKIEKLAGSTARARRPGHSSAPTV